MQRWYLSTVSDTNVQDQLHQRLEIVRNDWNSSAALHQFEKIDELVLSMAHGGRTSVPSRFNVGRYSAVNRLSLSLGQGHNMSILWPVTLMQLRGAGEPETSW